MFIGNLEKARRQAQANANLNGEAWVIFSDTNSNICIERQRTGPKEGIIEVVRPEITPQTRGLSVSVYRNADPFFAGVNASCTVTGKYHTVLLIGDECNGPISIEDWLKTHEAGSVMRVVKKGDRTYAVPGHVEGDGTGRWANNGNFLYSTDSRFTALFNGLPIMAYDYDMNAER
jgi:hypothetical protein